MTAIFTPFVDGVDDVNAEDVNSLQRFGAEIAPPPGRLTLETGVPISPTDQSAKSTLYYTLTGQHGNKVHLYDTTNLRWEVHTLPSTDISLSLAGVTPSTGYDVYVYSNSGTLTLEAAAWSGATPPTRAIQDGVYVKSADKSRLLLGSFYANSSTAGQTDDTATARYVSNLYNTAMRNLYKVDTTDSWTASGASNVYEPWNGSTANSVSAMFCISYMVDLLFVGLSANSNASGASGVAIGVDGTDNTAANQSDFRNSGEQSAANIIRATSCAYRKRPAAGVHTYYMLQWSPATPTATYYGDNNVATRFYSAMTGWVMA